MAKFTLYPPGNHDDALAGKPIIVDVPEPSSPPGKFKFPQPSFLPETRLPAPAPDPFGDDLPASARASLGKITVAPLTVRDDFAGLGDAPPSTSARSAKINLAPLGGADDYFNPPPSSRSHEPDADFTKNAAGEFEKFHRFTKIQEQGDGNVLVWGVATHEQPDLDSEICDYDTATDAYRAWSEGAYKRTSDAGQEPSLGNVRLQHGVEIGGKVTKVVYDDDNKQIMLGTVPFNDQVLSDLRNGFYTGYSQGGSYAWRKCTDCGKNLTLQQANNFCANCKKNVPVRFGLKRLSEVSYVDSPCTGKGFEYVKNDGTKSFISFTKRAEASIRPDRAKVLDSVRIFGSVWKHTVEISGRKRTVITRDGTEIVLVA